jgi:hypothetical protein
VIFPDESHGLSRMGPPSRRLARLHLSRDWGVGRLEPAGAPKPATEVGVRALAMAESRRA